MKVQPKRRLVKFESTKKGNTVIHCQVDFSARQWIVPEEIEYEENRQLVSPLISLHDIEPDLSPIQSKRSSLTSTKTPPYSTTVLSPVIEEAEEIETKSVLQSIVSEPTLIVSKIPSIEKQEIIPEPIPSTNTLLSETFSSVSEQTSIDIKQSDQTISTHDLPPIKSQRIKKDKQSKKKKSQVPVIVQDEEISPIINIEDNDPSLSTTEPFDVERTEPTLPVTPDGIVVFHKVGLPKKKKSKKKNKADHNKQKTKTKTKTSPPKEEPLVLVPRLAVPFVSALDNEQIEVEDTTPIYLKKKQRKRSGEWRALSSVLVSLLFSFLSSS